MITSHFISFSFHIHPKFNNSKMDDENIEWMNYPIIPGRYCCFKNPFKPVTHVIFDLDGTILDTEGYDKQILEELVTESGKEITDEILDRIRGKNEYDTCKDIVDILKLDIEPEELQQKYQEKNYKLVADAEFMTGAEKLINHLYEQQIPMAIATSSTAEAVELKFSKKKEFFEKFDHVVCGSTDPEVLRGKPAPNIYYVAARRFLDRPDRHKCLVFEDAFNGIRAALAADMQVVMTPDPKTPYERWKYATMRLDNLDQFVPELFGLPPYGSPIPPPKSKEPNHQPTNQNNEII